MLTPRPKRLPRSPREYGVPTYGLAVDVADEESVDAARRSVDARVAAGELPPVGAVVNIAGITSPVPFLDTTWRCGTR